MKGAALTICPDATLVDITHDIPPHDVLAGALELAAAWKYFPDGTIFVAVVDPGVGSARRAIAASAGTRFFVAPDNGLLTLVFRDTQPAQIVELSDPRFARAVVSRTFEGRDRFAPAAAWLATGIELSSMGRPIGDYAQLDVPSPVVTPTTLAGVVLHVDRFGNLITNIDRG
ncbi:MAG: SAM hydrolase/SAM-dependent halogenase family protein, partial [Vicinamibacterales bacterium]